MIHLFELKHALIADIVFYDGTNADWLYKHLVAKAKDAEVETNLPPTLNLKSAQLLLPSLFEKEFVECSKDKQFVKDYVQSLIYHFSFVYTSYMSDSLHNVPLLLNECTYHLSDLTSVEDNLKAHYLDLVSAIANSLTNEIDADEPTRLYQDSDSLMELIFPSICLVKVTPDTPPYLKTRISHIEMEGNSQLKADLYHITLVGYFKDMLRQDYLSQVTNLEMYINYLINTVYTTITVRDKDPDAAMLRSFVEAVTSELIFNIDIDKLATREKFNAIKALLD